MANAQTTTLEQKLRYALGLEAQSQSAILERAIFYTRGLSSDAWFHVKETRDFKYGHRPIRQREFGFATSWHNIGCRMQGPGANVYVWLGLKDA